MKKKKSRVGVVLLIIVIIAGLAVLGAYLLKNAKREQEIKQNPVYINEYMSSNGSILKDEDAEYNDWIEIINAGDQVVNLEGYRITDDAEVLDKWIFPSVEIQPNSYLIIFASGKDKTDPAGEYLHTNFALDRKGENLYFSKPNGDAIDELITENVPMDVSYGRDKSDKDKWFFYTEPTPGKENNTKGTNDFSTDLVEDNPSVYVNEVLVSNSTGLQDLDKEFVDWIEIYNPTDQDVNLAGYYLSDDPDSAFKWAFPEATIKSKEYMIVYASGKNFKESATNLHTNFKLNRTDEELFFREPGGKIIDKIVINNFLTDVSYGRSAKKAGEWAFFNEPTPGVENKTAEFLGILNQPTMSKPAGRYDDIVYVEVKSDVPETEIRYTTDGSFPSKESKLYEGPIFLDKNTVVRAIGYKDGYLSNEARTQTFFVKGTKHDLPVLSIAVNPKDFSDPETGIYSMGPDASSEFPYMGANFWKDIEIPMHFEYFVPEGNAEYENNAGLKVFGGWTRGYDQKSLAIMARDKYGSNEMNYSFMDNKQLTSYKNLVIRTGGQDVKKSKIKDIMFSQLAGGLNVDYMGYRQIVLYINGEYWGIYQLREKINEHFIANNNGIEDQDTVNLLEGESIVKHGTREEYDQMLEYIDNNDMSVKENYEKVKTLMDVSSFIDFEITQMYSGNLDAGNIRYWKANVEGGKWKWIVFDMDMAFPNVDHDTVGFLLNPKGTGAGNMFNTIIIRKLLNNDEFRQQFLERFAFLLKNNFSAENVVKVVNELSSQIRSEIPRNAERWGSPTLNSWEGQIYNITYYAERRGDILVSLLNKHLKLTDAEKALFA